MTRGSTNQEDKAPTPLGIPQIMLNVKRVKDNMRIAFIEKLFTNYETKTNM
jgi:hypothetical protein